MTNEAEQVEANRRHWDEVVPLHAASEFYDVAVVQGRQVGAEAARAG